MWGQGFKYKIISHVDHLDALMIMVFVANLGEGEKR